MDFNFDFMAANKTAAAAKVLSLEIPQPVKNFAVALIQGKKDGPLHVAGHGHILDETDENSADDDARLSLVVKLLDLIG